MQKAKPAVTMQLKLEVILKGWWMEGRAETTGQLNIDFNQIIN